LDAAKADASEAAARAEAFEAEAAANAAAAVVVAPPAAAPPPPSEELDALKAAHAAEMAKINEANDEIVAWARQAAKEEAEEALGANARDALAKAARAEKALEDASLEHASRVASLKQVTTETFFTRPSVSTFDRVSPFQLAPDR
jgi:hypothetical protein